MVCGMGFRLCQGTEGLAETGARDVPAEPGLGKAPQTRHLPALKTRLRESQGLCGKLSSAQSLDPGWFQDQANASEGGAGVLPKPGPVSDLGRDSGSVGRAAEGWRGRLFIH